MCDENALQVIHRTVKAGARKDKYPRYLPHIIDAVDSASDEVRDMALSALGLVLHHGTSIDKHTARAQAIVAAAVEAVESGTRSVEIMLVLQTFSGFALTPECCARRLNESALLLLECPHNTNRACALADVMCRRSDVLCEKLSACLPRLLRFVANSWIDGNVVTGSVLRVIETVCARTPADVLWTHMGGHLGQMVDLLNDSHTNGFNAVMYVVSNLARSTQHTYRLTEHALFTAVLMLASHFGPSARHHLALTLRRICRPHSVALLRFACVSTANWLCQDADDEIALLALESIWVNLRPRYYGLFREFGTLRAVSARSQDKNLAVATLARQIIERLRLHVYGPAHKKMTPGAATVWRRV